VSPGLIWCQESDGRVNIEYGHCKTIHVDSTSQGASAMQGSREVCVSPCVDTPVFTVGPNQNHLNELTRLIIEMAGVVLFSLPTDNLDVLPITVASSALDDINSSLTSIQSTVLLI